jgi:hypothetical protein
MAFTSVLRYNIVYFTRIFCGYSTIYMVIFGINIVLLGKLRQTSFFHTTKEMF